LNRRIGILGAGQLGIERAFYFSRPRSNVGIEIGFRNGKTEWTKRGLFKKDWN